MSPQMAEFMKGVITDSAIRAKMVPRGASWPVDALDRGGIERALVLSLAYINANDLGADRGPAGSADEYRQVREENDHTAAEAAKAPALRGFSRTISAGADEPRAPVATGTRSRTGQNGVYLHRVLLTRR
jgi:hypothetical protein